MFKPFDIFVWSDGLYNIWLRAEDGDELELEVNPLECTASLVGWHETFTHAGSDVPDFCDRDDVHAYPRKLDAEMFAAHSNEVRMFADTRIAKARRVCDACTEALLWARARFPKS